MEMMYRSSRPSFSPPGGSTAGFELEACSLRTLNALEEEREGEDFFSLFIFYSQT
jgi:hypothetical protein